MQVSYTTIHFTDFHHDAGAVRAILKRCVVFLLLVLVLLLFNTIEVSEKCVCGLEKGHRGTHQTTMRSSVRQLVEWHRLKQQHSNDLLK